MHISAILPLLPLAASTTILPSPQHIFANPSSPSNLQIPTSYESAILARRILHLTPLATISTTFPTSNTLENRPQGLNGMPIGLMDYIADCEDAGNPTILAISIATSFKNAAAGSNISLSLHWTPPYPPKSRISFSSLLNPDPVPYSAANLPRFALLGYLETIPQEEVETQDLKSCFVKTHQDARYWLPGNRIHRAEWVRLVVQEIYWVGGFGDRAYIGWIPVEEWRNVTRKEWEDVRLPGERKGWKEWAADGLSGWEL